MVYTDDKLKECLDKISSNGFLYKGKIRHCKWSVKDTGRIYSNTPNIQAIPKKDYPESMSYDFCNMELAIISHFAGLKDVTLESVGNDLGLDRNVTKDILYPLLYGANKYTISKVSNLSIPVIESKMKIFKEKYQNIMKLRKNAYIKALETGTITNGAKYFFKRELQFPELNYYDKDLIIKHIEGKIFSNPFHEIEKKAFSFAIQSFAASVFSCCLIDVMNIASDNVINIVHDEIVVNEYRPVIKLTIEQTAFKVSGINFKIKETRYEQAR